VCVLYINEDMFLCVRLRANNGRDAFTQPVDVRNPLLYVSARFSS
jgi:hypothetical protein